MGVLYEVYKEGEKIISLTDHCIENETFDSDTDIEIKPKLHGVVRNLEINGIINTSNLSDPPKKMMDDFGDPVLDEAGEEKMDLREIDSVRKLANWAIVPEYDKCYCDVVIKQSNAKGELVRERNYTEMFVTDYMERFDIDHGDGKFRIRMREREAVEE